MLNRQSLDVLDGHDVCKGPCKTFSVEGIGESYIDHIFCSQTIGGCVQDCKIIDDELANLSDHFPISLKLNIDNIIFHKPAKSNKIAWHKLSAQDIQ